jgi:regulator of protease activity HflC (stomatin/prohibitin superfamily)
MAAITSNVEKTPAPSRPGKLTKIFLILVFLLIAFILYKGLYQPDNPADHGWWLAGTGWLALGSLLMIPLVFPPGLRRLAVFLWLNLLLAIVISAFIQSQLVGNAQIVRTIRNSNLLMFMLGGFVESVIWSFVLGVILALLVTGVPLLILAYVASTYILALHGIEGVSRWDAMWCVVALILDVNLPFLVVQDGQSLLTKAAGKLGIIGGAGHLVVKQGNVAVLERGGKITRVVNAGVTKLRLLETIRNIFALGPQTRSGEIEHVLTKDRIPLKVSLTIKVQIEPASVAEKRPESRIAPSGEALTRKLDDGLYQVYEGTIMKAALTSQTTSFAKLRIDKCEEQKCLDVEESTWLKAAASLPEGELRDHIMSHRFDELFELVDSEPGERPEIRVNKRKIYEIEQAILEAIRATRTGVLGVMVRAVDIGKIEFPRKLTNVVVERMTVRQRARGQAAAIQSIGDAKAETLAALLDRVIGITFTNWPYADADTVRSFIALLRNTYQRALTDDVLTKEIMEEYTDALKKMAESEGTKMFSAGTPMDTAQLLASQAKTNGR